MFTKEQLSQWREQGFEFDDFYDSVAVDAKPIVEIKFISAKTNDTTYTINVEYITKNIKSKTATISLSSIIDINPLVYAAPVSIVNTITITKDTNSYSFTIQKNPFDLNQYKNTNFKATIISDGITAETKAFKLDISQNSTDENKDKKKTCYCNRDFTVEELKNIVIYLRKNEIIMKGGNSRKDENGYKIYFDKNDKPIPNGKDGKPTLKGGKPKFNADLVRYFDKDSDKKEIGDRIFYLKQTEQLEEDQRKYEVFVKEINKAFSDYNITSCIRKIHFLGQAYEETQQFSKNYESDESAKKTGEDFYRGRGLIQLTHDYNYKEFYKQVNKKEATEDELKKFVPTIAKVMKMTCQGSAWYWDKLKINQYADKDGVINVSAAINLPAALKNSNKINSINGLDKRKLYTSLFKLAMDYENCKKN